MIELKGVQQEIVSFARAMPLKKYTWRSRRGPGRNSKSLCAPHELQMIRNAPETLYLSARGHRTVRSLRETSRDLDQRAGTARVHNRPRNLVRQLFVF